MKLHQFKNFLPSRNTTIFFSIIGSIVGYKTYDTYMFNKIMSNYQDKAKKVADLPLEINELPTKLKLFIKPPTPLNKIEDEADRNELFARCVCGMSEMPGSPLQPRNTRNKIQGQKHLRCTGNANRTCRTVF